MSTPILSTKLHIPPPNPNLTPRPRLIERLNRGLRHTPGVTLISAPAGFGKTTLVNEWLRQSDLCAAWLSLDETDNDPTITASNQVVRIGIIANNCLPFGTKIKVKDNIYEVQDRMHERYGCSKFDIYMCDYYDAINFGIKELPYEII